MDEYLNGEGLCLDDCRLTPDEAYDLALREQWEAPLPFPETPKVEFPLETLPKPLAAYVGELSLATQTALEMSGILSLGLLASLFQDKYSVHITNNWTEPLSLFTMAVAPPAERKSAVLNLLTTPVREYENERYEEDLRKAEHMTAKRDVISKRIEQLKSQYARKYSNSLAQEISEAVDELSSCEEIHPFRLLVDDSTPEKLAVLMNEQGGSITVCSSEGGVFDTMCGRYDSKMNLDVYLKGHAADTIFVDRVGRPGVRIQHPHLSMMLAVQPDILNSVMKNRSMRGRGLNARFLYAICEPRVGSRDFIGADISEKTLSNCNNFVFTALNTKVNGGELYFGPDARAELADFSSWIERRLASDLRPIQDWGGKLVGAICRIAALIHCGELVGSDASFYPIMMDTLLKAESMTEFLVSHALAAYGGLGCDVASDDARYVLERMMSDGGTEFSRTQLLELTHGRIRKANGLRTPLAMLEDLGYIRFETRPTAGRSQQITKLNPLVYFDIHK